MNPTETNKPNEVTVVVIHQVAANHQKNFETYLKQLMTAASRYAGYQGSEIVQREKKRFWEYNVFYRFDNFENYQRWNDSDTKAKLIKKVHQHTLSSKKHSLSGLETWFTLSTDEPIIPPPKYKIVITTWIGVYALLLIIFHFLGKYLVPLNLSLRFLIVSILIVSSMTYLVMPLMTRMFAWWLYPKKPSA